MIGQKAALMIANMVLGTILGLVATILIGHFFLPEQVGQFNYAFTLIGLAFFITDLGMGQAHVKRVSEGRDPGDCFATYAVFKAAATLVFVLIVGAALFVYLVVLHKPLVDTTIPIIVVVMTYYVARALADVGQSSFDARLETAKSQLAQLGDTLVRVLLSIFFALVMADLYHHFAPVAGRVPGSSLFAWVAREPGLALAIATTAGALTAATVSITLLVRTLERGRFRMDLLRDYASFAFPLFVSSSIILFSAYVDGAVLGFFRSDFDVGVFGTVRRLPLVLAGLGTALSALFFPAVSAMVARGDHDGVQKTTDGALRYLSIVLVPSALFVAAFPTQLLHITIGDQWLPGAAALAILSIAVVITSFGHAHSFLLLGHDRSKTAARVGIASAIVLIVLNLALVPDDLRVLHLRLAGLGVTGAALASLGSGLVYYVGLRVATARAIGYHERNHLVAHAFGALVMVGGLAALDHWVIPLARWYHMILYMVVGATIYLAALMAVREVTRKDITYVRETLRPGEMFRYIAGEIRTKRE